MNKKFLLSFFLFSFLTQASTFGGQRIKKADLIFQTSMSRQSEAISAATESPYSHVGILTRKKGQLFVLEAVGPVQYTPLQKWIRRGKDLKFTIMSDRSLSDGQREQILKEAESYLGRPYDIFFLFDRERIYCSELIYWAYRGIGKNIGEVVLFKDLKMGHQKVQELLKRRWKRHPLCKGIARTFSECIEIVKNQPLITPASLTEGDSMELVFSTY